MTGTILRSSRSVLTVVSSIFALPSRTSLLAVALVIILPILSSSFRRGLTASDTSNIPHSLSLRKGLFRLFSPNNPQKPNWETGSPLTPYFEAPGITLNCGNSADFQGLAGDAVVTDPSYGMGSYATDLPFDPALLAAWVARYPSVAVMGYPELVVAWCLRAQVCPDEWVTWWPTNKPGARCQRVPRSTEHIAVFGATPGAKLIRRPRSEAGIAILAQEDKIRGGSHIKIQDIAGKSTREWAQEGDVWRDAAPGMMFNSHLRKHPNEKPVSLGHKLVTLCTNPGDTVIDYYAGSGAFLVAAVELGRKAIGVELDEKNCETIAKRFQQGRLI